MQFILYAPLVQTRGRRVVVSAYPSLVGLLDELPGDRRGGAGRALGPHDVHIPLLSLPRVFGTTLPTIPASVPYLAVDAALVAQWRQGLCGFGAFKVGIAWQAASAFMCDQFRSIPLECFTAHRQGARVQFFSLQKEHGREQLPAVAERLGIIDLAARLTDFTATAAVMKNLELVITADTVIAHVAGARRSLFGSPCRLPAIALAPGSGR